MTPEERLDQMVMEETYHVPVAEDDNHELLHDFLIKDGLEILPKAIQYINEYNRNASKCRTRNEKRLLVAGFYITAVDNAKTRLRAHDRGRIAISALENAIKRKRAGVIENDRDDPRSRLLDGFLKQLKRTNIKDGLIASMLRKRHNVKLSETRLLQFSNFLISFDPDYPAWTNIAGWAEMSYDESDKYYSAYLKFTSPRGTRLKVQ